MTRIANETQGCLFYLPFITKDINCLQKGRNIKKNGKKIISATVKMAKENGTCTRVLFHPKMWTKLQELVHLDGFVTPEFIPPTNEVAPR